MAPVPLNPTFANDLSSHHHLVNYIASSLSTRRYDRIPAFHSPSPREVRNLVDLWNELFRVHRLEIQELIRNGRGRRIPNHEMESTLEGLKVHSLSLRGDFHVDISEYELRSILPSFLPTQDLMTNPPFKPFGSTEAEVLALAKWFKSTYFKWVDPVKCPLCDGSTSAIGMDQPTPSERGDGAGRVELHKCRNDHGPCEGLRRFCRYGKIKALTRTREGRCGEWAQMFYTFLRVKGIQSRYVWNSEDHVWCEYWSDTLQHWVHVDPCEAATNKPLVYAKGWGKKQAYCLAFGPYGAEDVTRAYIDDWEDCKGRRRARGWNEIDLRRALYSHTVSLRLKLSPTERIRLEAIDNLQSLWIGDEQGRLAEAERMQLGGRTSGPEDWRAMRDELGLGVDMELVKPKFTIIENLEIGNEDLRIFGNTRINDGTILLTDGPSQTSSVFHPTPILKQSSFRSTVKFKLTSPEGGEADGIALVFTSEHYNPKESKSGLGLGGFGLGYDGLGGDGDFAIEIDTYRTQDYADDPPTPHISIHSPPKAHHRYSIGCTKPGSIPHLSDGRVYAFEVIYQSSSKEIKGYLKTSDGEEMQVVNVILPDLDTVEEPEQNADTSRNTNKNARWYMGITGACGGLWQKQEILDWNIDLIEFEKSEDTQVNVDKQKNKLEEVNMEKDEI
ncbi:uncharacterized protein IL334_002591 [Kwoniella shivajii]|uniref:Transglutaminase-like domain-containing protein n=1 Tax=Kwoniella shivajii TaxID=564305 RepID=A0ABZ1CY77_9TREE|nr:hypothetical protein IL334_002591 [Kwoniella shivajii]